MLFRSDVSDVRTLDKVGVEQHIGDFVLPTVTLAKAQQTMRVQRVGLHRDLVEGKWNTYAFPHHAHALISIAACAELALDVLGAGNAFLRQIRIQLKRQPAHGRLDIGLLFAEQLERTFEFALPDETPGSNNVGDDVDLQGGWSGCGIHGCPHVSSREKLLLILLA